MNKKIVSIYSIIHFLVDFACSILITSLVSVKMNGTIGLFFAILMYNFFAFAIQLPIGIIADKINKNAVCSAIGCLLVAISFAFFNYGIFACIVAGIGNAMFHVGGGVDVLNISNKKATLSGIYVATGAMGVFLGGKSLAWGNIKYFLIILALIISMLVLLWLYKQIKEKVRNEEVIIPNLNKNAMIAVVCLIITVCIRGYVGLILSFEWKSNFILAFISIVAVVLGKMLGGIIGDRIGLRKISLISLLVSAVCFIFAFNNSILGILSILFFNMTMPITLIALSNILNNNKGMAFGLLTVALFVGAVPVLFGYTKAIFTPIGLCITTLLSTIVLYIGVQKYYKVVEKQ